MVTHIFLLYTFSKPETYSKKNVIFFFEFWQISMVCMECGKNSQRSFCDPCFKTHAKPCQKCNKRLTMFRLCGLCNESERIVCGNGGCTNTRGASYAFCWECNNNNSDGSFFKPDDTFPLETTFTSEYPHYGGAPEPPPQLQLEPQVEPQLEPQLEPQSGCFEQPMPILDLVDDTTYPQLEIIEHCIEVLTFSFFFVFLPLLCSTPFFLCV